MPFHRVPNPCPRSSDDRRRAGAFVVATLLAGVNLASAGCASRSSSRSETGARPTSTVSALNPLAGLVRTVAYRHATLLYKQRDYTAAASTIDSLLLDPQRSPAERTFLLHQKALCEQALSGKSRPSPSPHAFLPATTKVSPHSADPMTDPADCGPRALLLVCEHEHVPADLAHLRQAAGTEAAKGGTSLEGLGRAARSAGFAAQGVQVDRNALANLSTPAVAWVDGNHYIAVLGVKRSLLGASRDSARIHDPNRKGEEVIPLADLLDRSGGVLLTLTPTAHSR